METNIRTITVHFPPANGREAHDEEVIIRSSNGHLMTNRLTHYLKLENDTKDLPEDERIKVDAPNELLLSLANTFVGMRKSMRRKDFALDRMHGENDSWKSFTEWMFGVLKDLTESSDDFFHAVLQSPIGGDRLLSQIPLSSDKFQNDLESAKELIATVTEDEAQEKCGDFPDDCGPNPGPGPEFDHL